MSEIKDAVTQMERAANGLRFYIKHNCMFGATDSPEGDVCTCGRMNAVNEANKAIAALRAWADAETSRVTLVAVQPSPQVTEISISWLEKPL